MGLFSAPEPPKVVAPEPVAQTRSRTPPTRERAGVAQQQALQQRAAERRRRGRGATILTGAGDSLGEGRGEKKTLLGG